MLLGLLFATSCQNISANTLPGVGEITSLEFSEVEIIDANLLLPPTLTSISFEYCWSKDWDKIGSRLANLTNLTKLVASGCELTESFCKVISKSRSLKELKLRKSMLTQPATISADWELRRSQEDSKNSFCWMFVQAKIIQSTITSESLALRP